jgi:hypothetical protein
MNAILVEAKCYRNTHIAMPQKSWRIIGTLIFGDLVSPDNMDIVETTALRRRCCCMLVERTEIGS